MILLVEKSPIDIMLDLGNWPDLSYSHEFSPQTDSNQHCLFGIYDSKLEQFEVDHGSDKSNDNIDLDGTDDAHNFNNFQNVEFFFFDNYPQIYSSTIGYSPPPVRVLPKVTTSHLASSPQGDLFHQSVLHQDQNMYNNNTIHQHEQIDTPMYPVWIRLLLKRMGFWNCDIPTVDTIRVEFEPISQFVLICVCVWHLLKKWGFDFFHVYLRIRINDIKHQQTHLKDVLNISFTSW